MLFSREWVALRLSLIHISCFIQLHQIFEFLCSRNDSDCDKPVSYTHLVIHERNELKNALEQAISDKEIGIILLTEKFGREFPEIIDEVRLHHKTPLIIEIPDRHGTGRKPDFITSYVNEAIGLKL